LRGLQRSGAAVVGLDIALTAPTPDDVALAQAIRDFSQAGVSRVVLAETMAAGSGPLAEPAFLGAVVRGSDRVPVDPDGVIRRAPFIVPQGGGPPKPALSLAIVARLASMGEGALETARRPEGRVPLPVWRAGGAGR
jgi:CHASE2 domain-containing sensor protein